MNARRKPVAAAWLAAATLSCVAVLTALAPAVSAQQSDTVEVRGEEGAELVERIIDHLDGIKSLSGTYTQLSTDGQRASGIFDFEFPDKMHFAESEPTRNRLISDGFWIASIEEETGEAVRYPIASTPFAAFLSAGLRDSDAYEVEEIQSQRDGDRWRHFLSISLTDQDALGTLTLLFLEPPLRLEGWIIRDAQDHATLVRLSSERVNEPINPRRFRIHLFER